MTQFGASAGAFFVATVIATAFFAALWDHAPLAVFVVVVVYRKEGSGHMYRYI